MSNCSLGLAPVVSLAQGTGLGITRQQWVERVTCSIVVDEILSQGIAGTKS